MSNKQTDGGPIIIGAYVCGLIAVIINLVIFSHASDHLAFYYSFAMSLARYFPILPIFVFITVGLLIYAGITISKRFNDLLEDEQGTEMTLWLLLFVYASLIFFGTLSGYHFNARFARGCTLPGLGMGGYDGPTCWYNFTLQGSFLDLMTIFYALSWLVFFPLCIFVFIVGLPMWAAAFMRLDAPHPTTYAVTRTVAQKRPDRDIERELWEVMERQDATDTNIEQIFSQLSAPRRWALTIQYKKRAKDAKRLREMADAKRQAFREENQLARSVHELERDRRKERGQ